MRRLGKFGLVGVGGSRPVQFGHLVGRELSNTWAGVRIDWLIFARCDSALQISPRKFDNPSSDNRSSTVYHSNYVIKHLRLDHWYVVL